MKLKIGSRLILGFCATALILAITVGVTLFEINNIGNISHRIVELRTPTATASQALVNNINASLAALRGYMLVGAESFKIERAAVWKDITKVSTQMDGFSKHWTNPKNVEAWNEMKQTLAEFKTAQALVEKTAKSPDEQPAVKILITEAAPKAAIVVKSITDMIDEEQTLESSPERKSLLGMMADVRGTMGLSIANIRAYLLTGERKFTENFSKLWAKNDSMI